MLAARTETPDRKNPQFKWDIIGDVDMDISYSPQVEFMPDNMEVMDMDISYSPQEEEETDALGTCHPPVEPKTTLISAGDERRSRSRPDSRDRRTPRCYRRSRSSSGSDTDDSYADALSISRRRNEHLRWQSFSRWSSKPTEQRGKYIKVETKGHSSKWKSGKEKPLVQKAVSPIVDNLDQGISSPPPRQSVAERLASLFGMKPSSPPSKAQIFYTDVYPVQSPPSSSKSSGQGAASSSE